MSIGVKRVELALTGLLSAIFSPLLIIEGDFRLTYNYGGEQFESDHKSCVYCTFQLSPVVWPKLHISFYLYCQTH